MWLVGLYRYRCRHPCTARCKPSDLVFCTLRRRLHQPLHCRSLCIEGRSHVAGAACWSVSERNKHQGADGHCRVDDCRENPFSCRAVSNGLHQIAQRQKTDDERTYTDGCNSTDRPAVDPAGRSRTDGEGDTVHRGQESDGGTAAAPIWITTWGMYGSIACTTLPMRLIMVAPIRRLQKNRTARRWFLCVISVRVV